MNNLVIMKDHRVVTTSLRVSENFEKEHKNVMRDILNIKKDVLNFELMFFESNEPDSYGRDRKIFYMNRKGFVLLAMSYTGKKAMQFKSDYIDAFDNMEDHIKGNQIAIPQNPMEALQLMFDVHKETKLEVSDVKNRVVNLEENAKLDAGEYSYINRRVRQRVTEVGRGYGSLTAKQRGELFRDMGNGINQIAGIQTRTQLKQKDFKMVCDFINDWEPSTATKTIIRQMTFDLENEAN